MLLLLSFLASAGDVTPGRARKVAETFYHSLEPGAALELASTQSTRGGSRPACYVFNKVSGGKGFVLVAGDDLVAPVIAYSTESCFDVDHTPENVRWWVGLLTSDIEYARSHSVRQSPGVAEKWSSLEKGVRTRAGLGGKLLNTALWNQGAPFNLKCPVVDGERSITGCVATATAIIMRYHSFPDRGYGMLPDYQYVSDKGTRITQPGHLLETTYDWNNMPTDNGQGWTSQQKEEVARLLFDVGVMSMMMYNPGASGAYEGNAVNGLIMYMNYKNSVEVLDQDSSSSHHDELVNEIDSNRPVLVAGSRSDRSSGHAFVLDGYDFEGNYHINFGWGGSSNGYFAYPSFGNYDTDLRLYTHLEPNRNGMSNYWITVDDISFADSRTKNEVVLALTNHHPKAGFHGEVGIMRTNPEGIRWFENLIPVSIDQGASAVVTVPVYGSNHGLGDYYSAFLVGPSDNFVEISGDTGKKILPLSEISDLEAVTSIRYDKHTGRMTVDTDDNALVSLSKDGARKSLLVEHSVDCSSLYGEYTIDIKLSYLHMSLTFKAQKEL